jgi:four helix bundle protein
MNSIRHFRDLQVRPRGMNIVEEVYGASALFPKSELYGLAGQIRRVAVSIPSNIAEGHSRESTKEYLNRLSIAQASLAELETQLEIAVRLGYTGPAESKPMFEEAAVLGKQLYTLRDAPSKRR